MDYRNLFGIAVIILSGSVFVHSLNSANAFPQGPNVSIGGNPIDHGYGNCNNSDIVFTNNASQVFIITDISKFYDAQYNGTELKVNGTTIWHSRGNFNFRSGLRVSPGDVVTCSGNNPLTISGYYTH